MATSRDVPAIARIHVLSWQAGYAGIMSEPVLRAQSVEQRARFWTEMLGRNNEAQGVWVAEFDGDVVGFVNAGPSREDDMDGGAEVYVLGVDPGRWGLGAGGALMREATDWLKSSGYECLSLWVLKDNVRARRFYDSLGWTHDGAAKERQFGDGALVEVRYVLA